MNARRLVPLAGLLAVTLAVAVDDHTTERITPTAAAVTSEAPAPAPFPALYTAGDCDSYRFIASQVWPEIDTPAGPSWAWVTKTMWRESRCQPEPDGRNDRNRCGQQSWGLLQVRFSLRTTDCADIYWDVDMRTGFPPLNVACGLTDKRELLNPAKNLECARWLFLAFGYKPWRT